MADANFSLSLEFEGDEIKAMLESIDNRCDDLTQPFNKSAEFLTEAFAKQFRTEGGFLLGGSWEPLKKPRPGKILDKTGAMKASLTDRNSIGHLEVIENKQMVFGSDMPVPAGGYVLATLHQTGTSRMPARKLFKWTREVAEGVIRLIKSYTLAKVKEEQMASAILDNEFKQVVGEFLQ